MVQNPRHVDSPRIIKCWKSEMENLTVKTFSNKPKKVKKIKIETIPVVYLNSLGYMTWKQLKNVNNLLE